MLNKQNNELFYRQLLLKTGNKNNYLKLSDYCYLCSKVLRISTLIISTSAINISTTLIFIISSLTTKLFTITNATYILSTDTFIIKYLLPFILTVKLSFNITSLLNTLYCNDCAAEAIMGFIITLLEITIKATADEATVQGTIIL